MSKTGGGPGTNQYAIRGHSRRRPAPARVATYATPTPHVDLEQHRQAIHARFARRDVEVTLDQALDILGEPDDPPGMWWEMLNDDDRNDEPFPMEAFSEPAVAYGLCGAASTAFEQLLARHGHPGASAWRPWSYVNDADGLQHHATVIRVDGGQGREVELVVDWTWSQWRGVNLGYTDRVEPHPLVLPLDEYGRKFATEIRSNVTDEADANETEQGTDLPTIIDNPDPDAVTEREWHPLEQPRR